jgi:hypothetical protein
MDLFKELIPSLNLKTGNIMDESSDNEASYTPFIVNKNYSQGIDTLIYANEMNKNSFLDKKLQYDFYYYGIDKKKRFNKWAKKDSDQLDKIKIVKTFFGISHKKAKSIMNLLTQEQLADISKRVVDGTDE